MRKLSRREVAEVLGLAVLICGLAVPMLGANEPEPSAMQMFELAQQWSEGGDLSKGIALARSMPEDTRLQAAELVGADTRAESRLFGAMVFYEIESVHSLLRLLTRDAEHGDPRVGQTIGWAMMHAAEDKAVFAMRFYAESTRLFIEQVEAFEGDERSAAILQLCGGDPDCGLDDLRKKLKEMEASIEKAAAAAEPND